MVDAALKCHGPTQIPSFVTIIPNGSETGRYLAVDLGGTNCRVCLVHLHGQGTYTMKQKKHVVPHDVRVNPSYRPLFAFIAERIRDFLAEHADVDADPRNQATLKLGFTFSFTYISHSLSQGTMVQWDKGWDIPNALGRDPCQMLQEAMDSLSLPVRVTALTNDSVGTLMSRAYTSPFPSATLLGAIFGTGTNAAYVERMDNISKLDTTSESMHRSKDGVMVVNTEWGALCDSPQSFLRACRYDDALDSASSNPTKQLLEKQISGLYLGELMRLAIVSLLEADLLAMSVPEDSPVFYPYAIDTSFLSRVLAHSSEELELAVQEISTTLQAENVSTKDANAIQMIAMAISKRSARLSGAAIAAIILQSGRIKKKTSDNLCISKTSSVPIVVEDEIVVPLTQPKETVPDRWVRLKSFVSAVFFCFKQHTYSQPLPPPEKSTTLLVDEKNKEHDVIDVGVDGSLYEFCPNFEIYLREALRDVPAIGTTGEARIRIGLAKDGSSVGAALVAV